MAKEKNINTVNDEKINSASNKKSKKANEENNLNETNEKNDLIKNSSEENLEKKENVENNTEEKNESTAKYTEEELLKQEHIVESILFMMGEPVEISTIALSLGIDKKDTISACTRLKEKYNNEHRGMKIIRLDQKYQMLTSEEYFDNLVIVAANPKKPIITDSIMETLAIIAYKQPITKTEIEKIRGVSSEHTVSKLLEYKLIEEAGRLDAPGRPILFKTTEDFMRRYGIETPDDLPILSIERQEEIKNEVSEEIKASFGDTVPNEETDNNAIKNSEEENENLSTEENKQITLENLEENNEENENNSTNNSENDNLNNEIGTKENPTNVEI